jgi:hypothetical protein
MHNEKMNFLLNPQIRMMEGVGGNPPPSLAAAGPPPPVSLWYDITKNMGIAIVSSVTGAITTFLVTKLWKYMKAKRVGKQYVIGSV